MPTCSAITQHDVHRIDKNNTSDTKSKSKSKQARMRTIPGNTDVPSIHFYHNSEMPINELITTMINM